jgi:CubicO group peptidase (beta-lactamase class C family)
MSLIPLPQQPADTPWPTDAWAEGDIPAGVDRARLGAHLDHAFSAHSLEPMGETHALVVIKGGRLILERYAADYGADSTFPSWSKAKSITHALVGVLVGDGALDLHAPADVLEWSGADDPRRAITLDLLLRMSSGLAFVEDYSPENPSDVIAMLFGEGKDDVAGYAAAKPLAHAPGAFWSYASGTTNIISRCLSRVTGASGPDFEAFMRERLFAPLGMLSPVPKFDAAGTFIGSSYCFCTARDFARFGLLYMRDGVWERRRLLPAGWVDYGRTKTRQQPGDLEAYGAHWWLDLAGPGSFSANGYAGQYTVVVPDLDLVVVRNGNSAESTKEARAAWIAELVGMFRAAD